MFKYTHENKYKHAAKQRQIPYENHTDAQTRKLGAPRIRRSRKRERIAPKPSLSCLANPSAGLAALDFNYEIHLMRFYSPWFTPEMRGPRLTAISSMEECRTILEQDYVILLKHSTQCLVSHEAYRVVEKFCASTLCWYTLF